MTWRELILVAAAGIASATIGQLLGRVLHFAWPIPISGSLVTALPRAIILLAVLIRVNKFGVLTTAVVAELGAKLALGAGMMWPMAFIAPFAGNLAGDLTWFFLRQFPTGRIKLMVTGAALCVARVLAAVLLWTFLRAAFFEASENLGLMLACIVAANAAFGVVAGFLVSRPKKTRELSGDRE